MPFFSRGRLNLSRTLFNSFGGGGLPPVLPGLKVGQTAEPSGGSFYGFGLGVGSLLPQEFLSTGQNITKLGAIAISDFANNGDFSSNGDWALATFDKLVLGEGLPDVGSVDVTINGITTTATFNAGSYESTDANAESIYNLLKSNVGTTYSFDIVEAAPSGSVLVVVEADAILGSTNTAAYLSVAATGGTEYGSLNPPIVINGLPLDIIYTLNDGGDIVSFGSNDGNIPPLVCTFDGQEFILDNQTPTPDLVTLLLNARDTSTPIAFTAEAI